MRASLNLNAVTLGVADIARSAAFYQLLGWTLSARSAPHIAILTTPPSAVLILTSVRTSSRVRTSEEPPALVA
jgi:catechol 2,3-dioxygenase-like lactoylglutathione lyase family enzyme